MVLSRDYVDESLALGARWGCERKAQIGGISP